MRTAEAMDILPASLPAFDGGSAAVPSPISWTLGELLSADDIRLDIEAATKREAIGHLADLLAIPAGARNEDVTAALLRRERLGPTYIGDGFAMPHGRVDGSSLVPAAAVLRLRRPVDYETTEDDAADILVGIAWPRAEAAGFVPSLAGIWRLIRKPTVAEAIKRAETPEEIHGAFALAGEPGKKS